MDASTGKILESQTPHKEKYPASLTKILTALVVIENAELDEEVRISEKATYADGTRVYLEEDETVSVKQLLHGIMISSGNDASVALAEHVSGSVEAFSEMMNDYMEDDLQLEHSHFSNPHGLFEEDHIATAYDLAILVKKAMKNDIYRQISNKTDYHWQSEGWDTRIYNHHPMRHSDEWTIAGKNGFVSKAGYTLATVGKYQETELIVITLDAPSRNTAVRDTRNLFERHFKSHETVWIDVDQSSYSRFANVPDVIPVTALKYESVTQIAYEEYLIHRGTAGRLLSVDRIGHSPSLTLDRAPAARDTALFSDDLVIRHVYGVQNE
ncbi:D-alanyl-D-alanine carboxypeptidase family protein [Salisediminibacterium beveridgei]|nr:D-alanyl-D-alanine carboxypeptidase family protein [Salisediminibacterium beveridgei]